MNCKGTWMSERESNNSITLIVTIILASTTFWIGYLIFTQPNIEDKSGVPNIPITISTVPYYLQNDSRWSKETIGGSKERIGDVGCTITCVAMSLSHKGYQINPKQLNKKLRASNGYTSRGWLRWYAITKLTNRKYRVRIPSQFNQRTIDRLLLDKKDVIAKVLINGSISHWVLIVGKKNFHYLVKDPLENSKRVVKIRKYRSKIYSIRWIEKS